MSFAKKEKKAETQAKIDHWKRERELKKLDSRADDAEEYAAAAISIAVVAVEEAKVATLEAVLARLDAEDAHAAS